MTKEFGTDHFYNADLFMEMVPNSNNVSYLSNTSYGLFKAMETADSKAIWSYLATTHTCEFICIYLY
jgi:alpha-N-acetylglucosaminidase